jgi:hypothetical protein
VRRCFLTSVLCFVSEKSRSRWTLCQKTGRKLDDLLNLRPHQLIQSLLPKPPRGIRTMGRQFPRGSGPRDRHWVANWVVVDSRMIRRMTMGLSVAHRPVPGQLSLPGRSREPASTNLVQLQWFKLILSTVCGVTSIHSKRSRLNGKWSAPDAKGNRNSNDPRNNSKQMINSEFVAFCEKRRQFKMTRHQSKHVNWFANTPNGLLAHRNLAPPSCPCPSFILFDLLDTMMLWMNSFNKSYDFVNQVMFWMDLFDERCDFFDEMTFWMNCSNESSNLMIGRCFERIQLINRLILSMIWCYSGIGVVALWCHQWSDVMNKLMILMNGCD